MRSFACVASQKNYGPVLYLKPVPGEVVLSVVVLCILLLLVQHAALKKAQSTP